MSKRFNERNENRQGILRFSISVGNPRPFFFVSWREAPDVSGNACRQG